MFLGSMKEDQWYEMVNNEDAEQSFPLDLFRDHC